MPSVFTNTGVFLLLGRIVNYFRGSFVYSFPVALACFLISMQTISQPKPQGDPSGDR